MKVISRNFVTDAFDKSSILSSVSAKAIIVAAFALGFANTARADDCGPGPTVTCSNPNYSDITYSSVNGLTMTIGSGVNVASGVEVTTSTGSTGAVNITIDDDSGVITAPPYSPQPSQALLPAGVDVKLGDSATGPATVVLKKGTINTTDQYVSGVYIVSLTNAFNAPLEFDMDGGTINVSGDSSYAAYVLNGGAGDATISMTDGEINTGGAGAVNQYGLFASAGAYSTGTAYLSSVSLLGGKVTVDAHEASAVAAISGTISAASASMSGGEIIMKQGGDGQPITDSVGLAASAFGTADATVSMTGGTITADGDKSYGLRALAYNVAPGQSSGKALVYFSGGTVQTTGTSTPAVSAYAYVGGSTNIVINGGTVTTSGTGSHGVVASSRTTGNAVINYRTANTNTTGANAYGVYTLFSSSTASADSVLNMYSGSVTTGDSGDPSKGAGSHAIFASNGGSGAATAFLSQEKNTTLAVQTYGAGAHGAFAQNTGSGSATATMQLSGTIQTAGDGSYGLAASISQSTNGSDVTANYFAGTIKTAGDGAYGVYAATPGNGDVTMVVSNNYAVGDILSTTGQGAHGAYSYTSGTGSDILYVSGATVSTSGDGSYGVATLIDNAGSTADITAQATGADISTQGALSHAFYLQNNGGGDVSATFGLTGANGSHISTVEDDTYGVYLVASQSGSASFSGTVASVNTSGNGAHAIYVTNQDTSGAGNTSIDYQAGTINVSGTGAYGLYAESLGSGEASVTTSYNSAGSSINVSGSDAFGVSAYSQGGETKVSLDAVKITATGNAKAAVGFAERWSAGQAATQATITFGGGLVIDASAAAGQHAFYNADDQAGTNMNLTTWGNVTGSANMGGGNSTFTLAGGSWTGDIYGDFDPSEAPAANQGADNFIWSGGTLNSGFYGQGGNDTATIYVPGSANFAAAILDGGEDGGAPESQIKTDVDQVTFAANNDSVAGRNINNWEKFTVNENVAIKFIDDGMTLDGYDGGNANGMGDLYMLAGSSVMGGTRTGQSFTLNGNLSNKGLLTMQDGAYGGNFIVEGDYTSDGGRLGLDVDFGDLKADVLTVGKDLGGVTQLEIADIGSTGNPGAILIVDTTTGTGIDKNEFTLDKKQMTASGIYAYGLEYSLEGDPGNGYPPGVYLSATGAPGPTPPGPTPPGPNPRLQPFVPLYEGYQSALLDMNTLPTMRQRVGKRAWLGREVIAPPPAPVLTPKDPGYYSQASVSVDGDGAPKLDQNESETTFAIPLQRSAPALENVWGRISGDFSHLDPTSSTTGYKYDLSTFEMQAGVDGLFYDDGPGALVGGLTVHYRTGEAKFDSVYGDSKVHPDGYGFGGTLTWYGDNGFYTDGQAQATWYSSELKADDLYKGVENSDAFGYAVSVEAGQQFLLDSKDLILTPQGQLAWSSVDIDSFTGAYNDDATFDNGDSLKARLGLAVEKEFISTDANGLARRGNVYGIANIYHEFMGETKAVIEQSFTASSELDPWTGEIGFGGTYDWTDANNVNYGVYGEVTAATGLSGGSYSYGGNLGFRVKW